MYLYAYSSRMVLIQLWMGRIIEPGEDKQLLCAGLPSFRYGGTESRMPLLVVSKCTKAGPFLSFFCLQNCLHRTADAERVASRVKYSLLPPRRFPRNRILVSPRDLLFLSFFFATLNDDPVLPGSMVRVET
jgi:hypothetical protein